MYEVLQVIREIKGELLKVSIVQSLVNSLIIFLVFYILLLPFTIPWVAAFIPTLVFFLISLIYYAKKRNLEYVESLFPLVNEQLRTAKDNLGKDNEIIRRLNQDVINKAKRIKTSFFLNFKTLNLSIIIVIALSLSIFSVSYLNINKINFNEFNFKNPIDSIKKITNSNTPGGGIGVGKDLTYGKESVALLGNNELNLQLNPTNTELNPEDLNDPEKKNFDTGLPQDIKSSAEANFKEDIPKENQEIVKNYFSQITKGK